MMNDRFLAAVQSPPLKGFSGFAFAEDGIVIGFKFLGAYRVGAGFASFAVHLTCGLSQIIQNNGQSGIASLRVPRLRRENQAAPAL